MLLTKAPLSIFTSMINADGGVLAIGVSDKTRRIEGVDENEKRLRNSHCGAGNKPARMVVGALIVKHVESLSDKKNIQEGLLGERHPNET